MWKILVLYNYSHSNIGLSSILILVKLLLLYSIAIVGRSITIRRAKQKRSHECRKNAKAKTKKNIDLNEIIHKFNKGQIFHFTKFDLF